MIGDGRGLTAALMLSLDNSLTTVSSSSYGIDSRNALATCGGEYEDEMDRDLTPGVEHVHSRRMRRIIPWPLPPARLWSIIATVTTTGTIGGVTAIRSATALAKARDPYNFPAAKSSYVGTLAAA